MKTIGLLGGMSWESSVSYYQALNRGVKQRLGGLHSAKVVLVSVDFEEIEQYQVKGQWDKAAECLAISARQVESAGADCILIGTNTMHKVAPQVAAAVDIPLLHIADATAEKLKLAGVSKVGLLGTNFTMEQDFYKGRLQQRHGIDVLVPRSDQRQQVHRIIYQELCLGRIEPGSREYYQSVIEDFGNQGAQAVILGCTEIALLIKPQDSCLPVFDTCEIHAQAALDYALAQPE